MRSGSGAAGLHITPPPAWVTALCAPNIYIVGWSIDTALHRNCYGQDKHEIENIMTGLGQVSLNLNIYNKLICSGPCKGHMQDLYRELLER